MVTIMVPNKSLDEYKVIAALLRDIHLSHGTVFNCRSLRLTLKRVKRRLHHEGLNYLTVALPRLGKAFDKALAGNCPLSAVAVGEKPMANSKLPRFLGEFLSRVLSVDGTLLHDPCGDSVRVIRQISYMFYKYELPFTDEQCQQVVSKFEETERQLTTYENKMRFINALVNQDIDHQRRRCKTRHGDCDVAREARILLSRVFASFNPYDVIPRHGPGAVSTKEKLWDKYLWTNVAGTITNQYPFDAYFCASPGAVCDSYRYWAIDDEHGKCSSRPNPSVDGIIRRGFTSWPCDYRVREASARVLLVPKDSRGPRLISCEPVDKQWVQQGLGSAIVKLVERHILTREVVRFTSQATNRFGALLGSSTGKYATLDLNEASDRVLLELVRLLFPPHIVECLEACRSSSTVLPSGKILNLRKFAPMGSSLCFPILALSVWAILAAASPDADVREHIAVYGDDVIVPTTFVENAIERLESFGLKINRDKSCTSGLFRESCGMDAFNGIDVTPVRIRTVWSSSRRPDVYTSWIAYANSFYDKHYFTLYDTIVDELHQIYGEIPENETFYSNGLKRYSELGYPSLRVVDDNRRPSKSRWNISLQKREWYVWTTKSPVISKEINGWSMLLRFFTEKPGEPVELDPLTGARLNRTDSLELAHIYLDTGTWDGEELSPPDPFSVRIYTRPRASMLVRRWR
jgi:hypothetical protein